MKNGIKTLAMWLIIGVIFIVVLSSIIENSDSKLKYSELLTSINEGNGESIQIESDGKTATVQMKEDKRLDSTLIKVGDGLAISVLKSK